MRMIFTNTMGKFWHSLFDNFIRNHINEAYIVYIYLSVYLSIYLSIERMTIGYPLTYVNLSVWDSIILLKYRDTVRGQWMSKHHPPPPFTYKKYTKLKKILIVVQGLGANKIGISFMIYILIFVKKLSVIRCNT